MAGEGSTVLNLESRSQRASTKVLDERSDRSEVYRHRTCPHGAEMHVRETWHLLLGRHDRTQGRGRVLEGGGAGGLDPWV